MWPNTPVHPFASIVIVVIRRLDAKSFWQEGEKLHISAITLTFARVVDVILANWPHQMLFRLFSAQPTWQQNFNVFSAAIITQKNVLKSSEETKLNFPWNSRRQHSAEISLMPRKSQEGGEEIFSSFENFIEDLKLFCLSSFARQSIRSGFCRILLCPEKRRTESQGVELDSFRSSGTKQSFAQFLEMPQTSTLSFSPRREKHFQKSPPCSLKVKYFQKLN